MRKILKSVILTVALIALLATAAFAAEEISVKLNGEKINIPDVAPVIENNEIFLPLRAVFEGFGADVYWEGETKTIISSLGETKVIAQIENKSLFLNSNEVFEMSFAPYIKNDRTLIVSGAVEKAFGCIVEYNEADNTVEITK